MRNDKEILSDYETTASDIPREKLLAEVFSDIATTLIDYQPSFKPIAQRLALKTLLEIRATLLGFLSKPAPPKKANASASIKLVPIRFSGLRIGDEVCLVHYPHKVKSKQQILEPLTVVDKHLKKRLTALRPTAPMGARRIFSEYEFNQAGYYKVVPTKEVKR